MIDVVFLSWNRLVFTCASLATLIHNTDWAGVARLVMYDDSSDDGTREMLEGIAAACPARVELRSERLGSPVRTMQRHLDDPDAAPLFAKIDNDVLVPPGWLPAMLGVLERNPDVELLGMEAGMTKVAGRDGEPWDGVYGFEPATNVGGVGVFRRDAFTGRNPMRANGRFGFTEWQHTHDPVRGWITPDLPVPLLDRLPVEPWLSLSAEYVERGWQRPWGAYDPTWMKWAWEWIDKEEALA